VQSAAWEFVFFRSAILQSESWPCKKATLLLRAAICERSQPPRGWTRSLDIKSIHRVAALKNCRRKLIQESQIKVITIQ